MEDTGDIFTDIKAWMSKTQREEEDLYAPKHNDRSGFAGLWSALITKTLHPGDPKSRCAEAINAVDAEISALRQRDVWDETNVMPSARA